MKILFQEVAGGGAKELKWGGGKSKKFDCENFNQGHEGASAHHTSRCTKIYQPDIRQVRGAAKKLFS